MGSAGCAGAGTAAPGAAAGTAASGAGAATAAPGAGAGTAAPGAGAGTASPGAGGATYVPLGVGPGPGYRPPAGARTIPGLACRVGVGRRVGVHVELFAHRHVVVVPAGIGVVAPRRAGAYVEGGRCLLPLITLEPTGVVELGVGSRPLRLGDLFAVWGQPLGARRLAGFGGGRVHAYVDGREVAGAAAAIVLRAHREVVLEIGGYVPPHRSYVFAGGL